MSIATNLHGRLRNTSLPYSNGLLPVFEAVANSIHAIEDAELPMEQGNITIEIIRAKPGRLDFTANQKKRGAESKEDITGFKITDNGIGFTDANMTSFHTLDSEYKAERGGRGVGRLMWLKAFRRVRISSIFSDSGGNFKCRDFVFRVRDGVKEEPLQEENGNNRQTVVHLQDFQERYRQASPKTARVIANNLLEHCLWYFVRQGGAPQITISDGDELIYLDQVYESQMMASASTEKIQIKEVEFELIHLKLSTVSSKKHSIAFCAANRLVKEESIKGKIPGLYGSLSDDNGTFVYSCYVSSPLLDKKVRSERTSFDIAEEPMSLFASTELSQKEIRDAIINRAKMFLAEYLDEKKRLGKERITSFVNKRAPRYRPILPRISDEDLAVDPDISDKDLDLLLHRQLAEIESQMLADGHNLMVPQDSENLKDYSARIEAYLKTVEDIKKSDLANYVSHRKVILDLLEMAIRRDDEGKYAREDLIHNLIMPMRKDSSDVFLDSCNLWLLDERLAFHDYLASDKALASIPITEATGGKKPDIVALNVFDNPILVSEGQQLPLASLVVVELKRPMRNDATQGEEKDPIEQALGYLDRIREGNVTTAAGRPIPRSEAIPGFCYVLCDLTSTVKNRCKMHDATRTSDGLGYFFYHKEYKAYVEVISFDRLLNAARERNRAFFDQLGLPT